MSSTKKFQETLLLHWSSWLLVLMFLNDLFTVTTKYKHCLAYIQDLKNKKIKKYSNKWWEQMQEGIHTAEDEWQKD